MAHNCHTCTKWSGAECRGICNGDWFGDEAFSTHPSDMHPCPHGEPIVASAVAGVEFKKEGTYLFAHHKCLSIDYMGECWSMRGGKWEKLIGWGVFCPHCGLRLPATAELPAMYDRWVKERDGK